MSTGKKHNIRRDRPCVCPLFHNTRKQIFVIITLIKHENLLIFHEILSTNSFSHNE